MPGATASATKSSSRSSSSSIFFDKGGGGDGGTEDDPPGAGIDGHRRHCHGVSREKHGENKQLQPHVGMSSIFFLCVIQTPDGEGQKSWPKVVPQREEPEQQQQQQEFERPHSHRDDHQQRGEEPHGEHQQGQQYLQQHHSPEDKESKVDARKHVQQESRGAGGVGGSHGGRTAAVEAERSYLREEFNVTRRTRKRSLVLVSSWRSGSSFVADLLQSFPPVFLHYEPLLISAFSRQVRPGDVRAPSLQRLLRDLLRCRYPRGMCDQNFLSKKKNCNFQAKKSHF